MILPLPRQFPTPLSHSRHPNSLHPGRCGASSPVCVMCHVVCVGAFQVDGVWVVGWGHAHIHISFQGLVSQLKLPASPNTHVYGNLSLYIHTYTLRTFLEDPQLTLHRNPFSKSKLGWWFCSSTSFDQAQLMIFFAGPE
jgi:hypothetical protein